MIILGISNLLVENGEFIMYMSIYSILHILTIVFPGTRNVKYLPIFHGRYSTV